MSASLWDYAADQLDPPPPDPRRWATPGAMAKALDPTTVQTPALRLIDQALADMESGEHDRLMVLMPPQEGKSTAVSRRYVEWVLTHCPDLRVAIISYADDIARRWGSDVKLDLETHDGTDGELDLGVRLRADSKAAGRWQIAGHEGGLYCTGIGGSLTGRAVDRLLVDDPLKDLEQAQSAVYRDRAWRFWQSVAVPRLGPGSKVCLIQTRWHEQDLAGRLLASEPGRWKVLSIPAIAEGDDDPLGRKPGEAMQSARGQRDWAQIRADVGEYVWAALYQQRPAPAEGGLFRRKHMRHWQPLPAENTGRRVDVGGRRVVLRDCWRFLAVDLAASLKSSADYTVAAAWAISLDGDLILLGGERQRVEADGHWPLVRGLRERHEADTVFVESRMFGTTLVYEAGRAGVPVSELHADTDKLTRALPAAARAEQGRLWFPPETVMPDVQVWLDELAGFPNAAHDDVTDVVAYAARVAAAHWLPMESAAEANARRPSGRESSTIYEAYHAATGNGRHDPLTQAWD